MIRRVAFAKAIAAGAAGAIVWEVAVGSLIALRVPLFDIVRFLGTTAGDVAWWQWWTLGLVVHAGLGAIWGIFYAHFFWALFPWRPTMQGLAFSIIPMLIAGTLILPQMALMHPLVLSGRIPDPGAFAHRIGPGGPIAIIVGHLIYGLTLGTLYVRPVGYRTGKKVLLHV